MQSNIFGETKLTGTIEQQLLQIIDSEMVLDAKDLLNKWAKYQHDLNEAQIQAVLSADRVARSLFKK